MDFEELALSRAMTRSFLPDEVPAETLSKIFDLARRVPSAGNSQGFDFVVLVGAEQTSRYWDVTLPASRRDGFAWPGLLTCPVLVTIWADPTAYTQRYAEPDKATTGLAEKSAWATPYWLVDASFAAMAMQYAALDAGLGVLFFGMFDHAPAVKAELGVPAEHEPVGTLALGWADERPLESRAGLDARPRANTARSADRPRRPLDKGPNAIVHYGAW